MEFNMDPFQKSGYVRSFQSSRNRRDTCTKKVAHTGHEQKATPGQRQMIKAESHVKGLTMTEDSQLKIGFAVAFQKPDGFQESRV